MDNLPPEILANAFEIGVLTWGIPFLLAVCLVCREWNDVVQNTPHLWGIVQVTKSSGPNRLLDQIVKAKDAPLTVYISPRAADMTSQTPVLAVLIRRCNNWARATVPSEILRQCQWSAMFLNTLEDLQLVTPGFPGKNFFKPSENDDPPSGTPALRVLSMGVVRVGDLDKPSTFSLPSATLPNARLDKKIPVLTMLDQLSRTPNTRTVGFRQVVYQNQAANLGSNI